MRSHQQQPTLIPHAILSNSSKNIVFQGNNREASRSGASSIPIPRLNNFGAGDEGTNRMLSGPARLSRSYGDSYFGTRLPSNHTYANNERCVSAHILGILV